MKTLISLFLFIASALSVLGQSCSVTISGNQNWSTASWSCNGGASAPTTPGGVFNGTLNVTINNNANFNMNMSLTLNGTVNITTNGNADFTVATGNTLDVNGDFDASNENNIDIIVDGKLQVSGTMEVKNGNAFSGSGIVSGGSLIVKNNNTCGAGGCPTIAFSSCTDGNNNFCSNNNPSGPLDIGLGALEVVNDKAPYQLEWQMSSTLPVVEHSLQGSVNGYEWEEVRDYSNDLSIVGIAQIYDFTVSNSDNKYYRVLVKNSGEEKAYSNVLYLGTNTAVDKGNSLRVSKSAEGLSIQNNTEEKGHVVVSSLAGQQLLNSNIDMDEALFINGSFHSQTFLVVFIPDGKEAEVQKLMIR